MKKITYFILMLSLALFHFSCNDSQGEVDVSTKASVVFPVTIDAFEQLKQGVTEVCGKEIELSFYSAEGDAARFETVVQSGLLNNPDYLVTIGTQITNTAFSPKFKGQLNTVIAGAISSPELVESLLEVGLDPPRNARVAIISDSPQESIYDLFSSTFVEILPQAKKVGIIYNEGEVNSKGTAKKTVNVLKQVEIEVEEGVINSGEDIDKVVEKLILNGVEAIIIPHDKNAVTKASSIVKKCLENGLPVFSLDDGTVKKDGVAVGISVNYKIIGKLIGETLLKVHQKGKNPGDLPIVAVDKAQVYLNKEMLDQLGIIIPESINEFISY